jgi:hypothetical protein
MDEWFLSILQHSKLTSLSATCHTCDKAWICHPQSTPHVPQCKKVHRKGTVAMLGTATPTLAHERLNPDNKGSVLH